MTLAVGLIVRVRYTNYRGEVADRTVRIMSAPIWTATDWHPELQWLIWVLDLNKNERRLFALKDMIPAT